MTTADPRLREFMQRFNAGEYWDSHEVLEGLWRETAAPHRDLYQGLIQAAAAMVHWQRGNRHGVEVLAGKAKRKLVAFLPAADGLALREFLADWEQCLFQGGPPPRLHWCADETS